jgi:hypothetical protein
VHGRPATLRGGGGGEMVRKRMRYGLLLKGEAFIKRWCSCAENGKDGRVGDREETGAREAKCVLGGEARSPLSAMAVVQGSLRKLRDRTQAEDRERSRRAASVLSPGAGRLRGGDKALDADT